MDEGQRDDLRARIVLQRYMRTTADGVQMGPTWWAEQIGASFGSEREWRVRAGLS
jgi:hypothetical protein